MRWSLLLLFIASASWAADDIYLSPAGAERKRLAGLEKMSEDMRKLLVPPRALPQEKLDVNAPDEQFEWLVDLELPKGKSLDEATVVAAFTQEWFESLGFPGFYGKTTSGKWATPRSLQGTEPYVSLVLGVRLYSKMHEPNLTPAATLEKIVQAAAAPAKKLGITKITPRTPASEGAARGERQARVVERCYFTAAAVVKAKAGKPFDGREVWDVMNSLGLSWGDQDLFHWSVPEVGQDLIRVWTTTPPEYFLPEPAKAGELKLDDIVFEFEVHASPAPDHVAAQLWKAASYAARRLGGTVTDHKGKPLDQTTLAAAAKKAASCLTAEGFPPGSYKAHNLLF